MQQSTRHCARVGTDNKEKTHETLLIQFAWGAYYLPLEVQYPPNKFWVATSKISTRSQSKWPENDLLWISSPSINEQVLNMFCDYLVPSQRWMSHLKRILAGQRGKPQRAGDAKPGEQKKEADVGRCASIDLVDKLDLWLWYLKAIQYVSFLQCWPCLSTYDYNSSLFTRMLMAFFPWTFCSTHVYLFKSASTELSYPEATCHWGFRKLYFYGEIKSFYRSYLEYFLSYKHSINL